MKYLFFLISVISFSVNAQILEKKIPTKILVGIDQTLFRLNELVDLERFNTIIDFHRKRASLPKIHIRDPYKEVFNSVTLDSANRENPIFEKITLKIQLEDYLRSILETETSPLDAQNLEKVNVAITLLQKVSNKVIDADPKTSTLTTYTVCYANPLKLAHFLNDGVDKGMFHSDILKRII